MAEVELSVRLGAYEGASGIAVGGAVGGDLEFHLEDLLIRCSNGAVRREFVIRPRSRALVLGGRSYPGTLRVVVRPEGGLRAEVHLDLEEYVSGVVAGELPLLRALPAELEAQMIAARSYALVRLFERRRGGLTPFVWDDTRDQVYVPLETAHTRPAREVRASLEAAVHATRGQILFLNGRMFDARYHASCGGSTCPLPAIPGSASVACPGCMEEPSNNMEWGFTATPEELTQVATALGIGDRVVVLEPTIARDSGRWEEVHLIGNSGSCTTPIGVLRSLFGAERFAGDLVIGTWPHPGKPIASGLRIDGRGRGHGVGMCQEGAHELAQRGWSSTRILGHYYPGTSTRSRTVVSIP